MTDQEFQMFVVEHLKELRESQARMEFKNEEKLSALFDGYASIKETLSDHTQRLQRIEDKLETHQLPTT